MAEVRYGGLTCEEASDLAAAFVLDALEPDEEDAVRAHLAACPELHPAFAEVGAAVPALLESVPIAQPPAHLGRRIMEAAARESNRSAVSAPAGSGAAPPTGVPIPSRTRPTPWTVAFGLAAALAIVALGAWNLALRQGLDAADRYAAAVTATLELAARPGSVTAVLAPAAAGGPAGLAAVGADGSISIAVRGLVATSGREVYAAWAIPAGGSPVAIGTFRVGADGTGALTNRAQAAGPGVLIALTREAAPDPTTPTLPIVASGQTLERPS